MNNVYQITWFDIPELNASKNNHAPIFWKHPICFINPFCCPFNIIIVNIPARKLEIVGRVNADQLNWFVGSNFKKSQQSAIFRQIIGFLGEIKSTAVLCLRVLSLRILFKDISAWLWCDLLWIAISVPHSVSFFFNLPLPRQYRQVRIVGRLWFSQGFPLKRVRPFPFLQWYSCWLPLCLSVRFLLNPDLSTVSTGGYNCISKEHPPCNTQNNKIEYSISAEKFKIFLISRGVMFFFHCLAYLLQ